MEWKPGDALLWKRATSRGYWTHHTLKAVLIKPGVKTCGIAILNTYTGVWQPHRSVPVKSLMREKE